MSTASPSTTSSWPVLDGKYLVGDPDSPVAVCTLNTEKLVEPLAGLPGVAITGPVFTANLGIERIVVNVTANPAIRFLVLCGRDSKIFRPGQSLGALADNGIDGQGQILGAEGYDPVLPSVPPARIDVFRRQVEVVDRIGEDDVETLQGIISDLAGRSPGKLADTPDLSTMPVAEKTENFVTIRPGGQKEPLLYDPKGYFVISLDRDEDQIILRHYLPDHTPAHEMRGRVGSSMFLGLVREGLVSQLSHAGYLGEELAKAETALRLDLRYTQDHPLKRPPQPAEAPGESDEPAKPAPPRIQPTLTWEELSHQAEGAEIFVALEVTDLSSTTEATGRYLDRVEADPFSSFHRTDHPFAVTFQPDTKAVMGTVEDVKPGAFIKARGVLRGGTVAAVGLVIMTNAAKVE
jgi:tetrahydromethanopterin S-methyltransferase subunit A